MKRMRVPLMIVAAALGHLSLSACALTCSANAGKLASLRRGMSYDETVRVMGCRGTVVTAYGPSTGDYAIVEWNGPDSPMFKRTLIDFLDGKLLSYTTEQRGAL